jgi:cobalt-zinc-cadmium efflux system membrane fusion protein
MSTRRGAQRSFVLVGVVMLAILAVGVIFITVPSVRATFSGLFDQFNKDKDPKRDDDEIVGAALVRDANGNAGLRLTKDAFLALNVTPAVVKVADKARPLPPQIGTLNYDNDRLFTIRSRFPGELAEVRRVLDTGGPISPTQTRPLRFGDRLKQGDLVAVVWSQSLGQAKAALVDAICSLRLSKDTLDRQSKIFQEGAMSIASLKASERQVQTDNNALLTAERSLKMWKLTNAEIKAIKDEANIIADQMKTRSSDNEKNWARVEIRVPKFSDNPNAELVVVEKNTNINDMVDPINSPPLFKLADTSRLQIWVHPPEEYLPLIREGLKLAGKEPLKWHIRVQSEPADSPPMVLNIVQIAPSLEPNQHTPMVMGYLDNPDGKYLIGQFVTATIYMPPDRDTVEIPTNALNEVEGQALVFVQNGNAEREYILRRVAVVRRFKDRTFVRGKLTGADQEVSKAEEARGRRPLQPLLPGERVITRGVVELTGALEEMATKEHVALNKATQK